MGQENEDERRKPWGCAVTIVVLFPILYALALGPAAWLHSRSSPLIQDLIEIAFAPLLMVLELTRGSALFDAVIDPYVRWWDS